VIRESQHLPIADSLLALVAEIGIDGSEFENIDYRRTGSSVPIKAIGVAQMGNGQANRLTKRTDS